MKKILLFLIMLVGVLAAQAEDYTYLTFETTDGAKTSVDISSLPVTINLDNSTLTIGNQTFTLDDLSKMYFSTTDQTAAAPTTPVANGLAFSSETATAKMGEAFTEPTLTNPYDLTVAWSSSDEGVATVDQTGTVTLVAAGTTTITATYDGSDEYEAGSVSYKLTVEIADGISELNQSTENGVSVYSLSGNYLGRFNSLQEAKAKLRTGIYIIKESGRTSKISVKK